MEFHGTVGKGRGLGTIYGFPTANIPLDDESVFGVYAAKVTVDGAVHKAAVYADQGRKLLEAHLLDFDEDLYGKEIVVVLGKQIREDDVFVSEDELRKQIAADVAAVREHMKNA